jgi:hypothetical protein
VAHIKTTGGFLKEHVKTLPSVQEGLPAMKDYVKEGDVQ